MRLRGVWRRLFGGVGQPAGDPEAEAAAHRSDMARLQDRVSELRKQVRLQKRVVAKADKAVTTRRSRLEANDSKGVELEAQLAAMAEARDSLVEWLQERSNSMALHVLTHVDDQMRALKTDEAEFAALAEAVPPDMTKRAEKLRKSYIHGVWISLALALLLSVPLMNLLGNAGLHDSFNNEFGSVWWHDVLAGILILVVSMTYFLARYHRGFSQMVAALGRHLDHCSYVVASLRHIRQERVRLGAVESQLQERLGFLGSVLQEPWKLPPTTDERSFDPALARRLPSMLQLATASADDEETRNSLRREFIARGFTSDMRGEAYRRSMKLAARKEGLGDEASDVRWVNKDQSPQGLRRSVMVRSRNQDILQEVGQRKLDEIMRELRAGFDAADHDGLLRTRPPVLRRNANPLDGMSLVSDGTERLPLLEPWDSFVAEILEGAPALSPLTFSSDGRRGSQVFYTSMAVAPVRLAARIDPQVAQGERRPQAGRGTEITTRVDITPHIDVHAASLFLVGTVEEPATVPADGVRPQQAL